MNNQPDEYHPCQQPNAKKLGSYCNDDACKPKPTETNQPVDTQSDETLLTDEFDKNNLKSLLAEFEDAVYCTSGSSSVQNMAAQKRAIQAKSKIIAWHETEKQKAVELVDRFEVIDHRECVYCRGRATANYLQKDGSYKEQLCDKCDGSGIRGGRVYGAFSNPETSIIKVELSYQDNGKTLKVFVSDRELNKAREVNYNG